MKDIYDQIGNYLKSGESVVLCSIIDNTGSTPREIGSKMIVRDNGSIEGSIGGGILEAMVQRYAADVFGSRRSGICKYSLSKEDVANIGMTCGGNVAVFLKYIDAADTNVRSLFERIRKLRAGNKKAWVITAIEADQSYGLFVFAEGEQTPEGMDARDFEEIKHLFDHKSHYADMGKKQYMTDPLVISKAFIFGGGHIGYELAVVLERLDFNITIIDDREEYASNERFPQADALLICPFGNAVSALDIGPDSYIIIVTRGHMHDETVLAQALKTKARYIGMIGSRIKRDNTIRNLLEKGFTQKDIDRVHSPIGLMIGAHTPSEIAISIAAELIQERADD